MEFASLELSLVSLVFVYVLSRSHLFILFKLSLIDSSVGLFEYSMSFLLSIHKLALVFGVVLEVVQFSEPMKLISMKLSFVLSDSLQKVLSLALLHSFHESSLVAQASIGFEGSTLELIFLELSCKLIPIGEVELAVASVFPTIYHRALELRAIDICNFAHCELSL